MARYFGVEDSLLGGPLAIAAKTDIWLIPKLAVGVSAGPGAIPDRETLAGKIGFDKKWLRKRDWTRQCYRSFRLKAIPCLQR